MQKPQNLSNVFLPAFLNGLRLGFIEFEVKVFDERILCAESIHSILLLIFFIYSTMCRFKPVGISLLNMKKYIF